MSHLLDPLLFFGFGLLSSRLDLTATDSPPRSSENSSTKVYRQKQKADVGHAFYSAGIYFHFSTRARAEGFYRVASFRAMTSTCSHLPDVISGPFLFTNSKPTLREGIYLHTDPSCLPVGRGDLLTSCRQRSEANSSCKCRCWQWVSRSDCWQLICSGRIYYGLMGRMDLLSTRIYNLRVGAFSGELV